MKQAISWLYVNGHDTDIEYLLNDCKRYMQELVKSEYKDSDASLKQMKKACSSICRLNTEYKKATGNTFLDRRIKLSSQEDLTNLIKEFIQSIL
jgi:hypothetical protein